MFIDFQHDMFPETWFSDFRELYGSTFSEDMILKSVSRACEFFHIIEPMDVMESDMTGVYPFNPNTMVDDVLVFNDNQLMTLGITEQDGLDMVMTHEMTHRVLQGMDTGFDSHTEELCCDFMAGVRAGLNGLDASQMEESLQYTHATESHPDGADRVDSVEAGVRFANEYFEAYGAAPTFRDCLDYFTGNEDFSDSADDDQVNLSEEEVLALVSHDKSGETTGSVGYVDDGEDYGSLTFRGYTKEEINRNMNHAQKEQRHHESLARHHTSLANNALTNADAKSHLREAGIHQNRADEFKREYQKWKWTKPDNK